MGDIKNSGSKTDRIHTSFSVNAGVFILFVVFLVVFGAIYLLKQNNTEGIDLSVGPKALIKDVEIPVEVVDTDEARRLGLSHRKELNRDSGMLFDMQNRETVIFWMKDMNFPLDIIWIDGSKIVNISKELMPAGNQPSIGYSSKFPINFVLEVNGGFCEKNNINIGDKIALQ